ERTREKGFPNNSRSRAVPCNRGSDTAHAGEGAILGPRRRICRAVSWPRILPRIRSASVYLVNFSRLRRLAHSRWSTCARSPRWTKKRAVTMKKLLLTSIATLFLATGAANAASLKTNIWVSWCSSKDGTEKKAACIAYALGLFDGLILWYANSADPIKICMPRDEEKPLNVNMKQVVDIGLEYIRRHPDSGPRPIAVVLREAIEEAFPLPCKEM